MLQLDTNYSMHQQHVQGEENIGLLLPLIKWVIKIPKKITPSFFKMS